MPNYFVRHWRGELPLGLSYWVNGLLANVAAYAAVGAITATFRQFKSNYLSLLVGISAWTVVNVIVVWQLVGIWRSAGRPGNDGKTSRWAGLARVAVVLGFLRAASSLVGEGVPAINAAAQQALWLNEHGKWNVRLLNNGTELELSGGIGSGFSEDLQDALTANPGIRLVHLNLGSGGLIDEAKSAAVTIRKHNLPTYVSGECVSACTYAFLGGTQRYLKVGAKLGFHAPTDPLAVGYEAEKMREAERQYLITAGVSSSFSARAIATPARSMWYPTHQELIEAGVVTQVTGGDAFAISGAPVPSIEELRTTLEKTRIFRALKNADPVVFDKAVRASHDALLQGKSMEDLRTTTIPLMESVYAKALPNASDEALVRFGNLMVAALKDLQSAPPRVCLGYINSGNQPSAREAALRHLSMGVKEAELDVMAQVMESAAPGRSKASERQQAVLFPKVFDYAKRLVGDDILAIQDLQNPNLDPAKGCRAAFAFYSGVMSLPTKDAAPMLRFLLASGG